MSASSKDEAWKKVKLDSKLSITLLHKHELARFKTGEVTSAQKNAPDDSEDENKWFCNGGEEELGFVGGCKSGQKTFGYHEGTEGWQCPDLDNCDFDLCEMCVRWALHCEKTGTDLGLVM